MQNVESSNLIRIGQRHEQAFGVARKIAVGTLKGEPISQHDMAQLLRLMSDQARVLSVLARMAAQQEKSTATR